MSMCRTCLLRIDSIKVKWCSYEITSTSWQRRQGTTRFNNRAAPLPNLPFVQQVQSPPTQLAASLSKQIDAFKCGQQRGSENLWWFSISFLLAVLCSVCNEVWLFLPIFFSAQFVFLLMLPFSHFSQLSCFHHHFFCFYIFFLLCCNSIEWSLAA